MLCRNSVSTFVNNEHYLWIFWVYGLMKKAQVEQDFKKRGTWGPYKGSFYENCLPAEEAALVVISFGDPHARSPTKLC